MPPQIIRLVLLTIAIVSSYGVARHLLTPSSFGQYGHYRADALLEISSLPQSYGGQKTCDECHSEILIKVGKSPHAPVACEACHGPGKEHSEKPEIKNAKLDDSLCKRCHEGVTGRPAWHKQITLKDHYTGQGPCKDCHIPHQPNEVP